MTPFTVVTGRAALVPDANIDTDQIIPARFLREPRSAGYQNFLFADALAWRDAVQGAAILLAGANFGCGSSREGAVYALVDAGIRCVIAPSFGDIFAGNAAQNGLLLLTSDEPLRPGPMTIDLPDQCILAGNARHDFAIEPFRKRRLLEGLDDIGLILTLSDQIAAWDRADRAARPWVSPAAAGRTA